MACLGTRVLHSVNGSFLLPLVLTSLVSASRLHASDPRILAVQNALRSHEFLFEEPTGNLDDATRAALRRFQIRYDLQGTGEIDEATIEVLHIRAEGGLSAAQSQRSRSIIPGIPEDLVRQDRELGGKSEAGLVVKPARAVQQLAPEPLSTARSGSPAYAPVTFADQQFSNTPPSPEPEKRAQIPIHQMATAPVAAVDEAPSYNVKRQFWQASWSEQAAPCEEIAVTRPVATVAAYADRSMDPDERASVVERRIAVAPRSADPDYTSRRQQDPGSRFRRGGFFHRLFHRE